MEINFNDVKTGGGKSAMPEGWYTVKAAKAELLDSKNGPKTMINAEFNIMNPDKYAKRKVWNNFNLGPTSLWVLKTFLESSGSNVINQGVVDESIIAAAIPGLSCDVYLEPDKSPSGDPRNRITNYRVTPGVKTDQAANKTSGTSNTTMFK